MSSEDLGVLPEPRLALSIKCPAAPGVSYTQGDGPERLLYFFPVKIICKEYLFSWYLVTVKLHLDLISASYEEVKRRFNLLIIGIILSNLG